MLFHKIKSVKPLNDLKLQVSFDDGVTKLFDVKQLFNIWEAFKRFQTEPKLFYKVEVAPDGCGIIWNDNINLAYNFLNRF